MPPRYAYWTIIAGGLPTAFRATEREELLPTFQRIREKHPDAQMKWFARGKLWDSPEAARVRHDDARGRRPFGDKRAGEPRDHDRGGGPPYGDRSGGPPHAKSEGPPAREKRSRDWRPGGEHRDPRQKFVDAKTQKNAALRQDRWQKKNAPLRERPHGAPPRNEIGREPRRDSPRGDWQDRPPADRGARPDRHWQDRPRDPSRRSDAKADPSRRSDAKADARGPQGKSAWRPKPGGWTPEPGFRGRDTEKPRNETPKPTPPPRRDEPVIPPPRPSERGHIKSRRPFRPRHEPPKGPRR